MDQDPGILRTRLHWAYLVSPSAVLLALIAIVLLWAVHHQATIAAHLPSLVGPVLRSAVRRFGLLAVLACAGLSGFIFLGRLGWWQLSLIEIDDANLIFRLGPFSENRIPLRAIQDIQVTRSLLGLILGYGTLLVDAGREEEVLAFMPDVDAITDALAWYRRQRSMRSSG